MLRNFALIPGLLGFLFRALSSCGTAPTHDQSQFEMRPHDPRFRFMGSTSVLACEESRHDFGKFWVGPRIEHEFIVKNVSDQSWRIRIIPSLSGAVHVPEFAIEAGQVLGITLGLDSNKLRGRFEKTFSVRLSHPPADEMFTCRDRELPSFVRVLED